MVAGVGQLAGTVYAAFGLGIANKILEPQIGAVLGNPDNNYSIRELAHMMLDLAADYPEYAPAARNVAILDTTASAYYGAGYQDVQNRVPKISSTIDELGWTPRTDMAQALRHIFDAYRGQLSQAKELID